MCMPIINPMYLYLIEVLHNLDVINHLVFIPLVLCMCFVFVSYVFEEKAREKIKANKSKVALLFVAFTISGMMR